MFNLNNVGSPYPHATPRDHAELRYAASLRRGASVWRPQPGNIQTAGHCGSGTHGWRQAQTPHCCPQTHSLLPDRHGQYPSPALGYLTCSGIFMKVPSETPNRGYAGLSQGPAGGHMADSAVGLSPHRRQVLRSSSRWSGGTVRSRMESEDGCTLRPSC